MEKYGQQPSDIGIVDIVESIRIRLLGGPEDGAEQTLTAPLPRTLRVRAVVGGSDVFYHYVGTDDGVAVFSCLLEHQREQEPRSA